MPRKRAGPLEGLADRGRRALAAALPGRVLLAQREQQAEQPCPALARGQDARIVVAERHEAEAVAATGCRVADGQRGAFGHIGLAALGRAERHRGRGVEHEPGHERSLGQMDADVRCPGPRRHVPIDLADVVLDRLVRPDLRQLTASSEQRRPVVARQHALDATCDRQVERAQQRLGHRAGPGACRRLPAAEQAFDHAACPARSSCGTGTAATISSSRLSGLRLLGQRLVGEHHAVAQRVLDELLQILHEHVLAPAHDGEAAGGVDQRDRPARAGAERDEAPQVGQPELAGTARRSRELEGIADEARIDVDPAHDRLDLAQVLDA